MSTDDVPGKQSRKSEHTGLICNSFGLSDIVRWVGLQSILLKLKSGFQWEIAVFNPVLGNGTTLFFSDQTCEDEDIDKQWLHG